MILLVFIAGALTGAALVFWWMAEALRPVAELMDKIRDERLAELKARADFRGECYW